MITISVRLTNPRVCDDVTKATFTNLGLRRWVCIHPRTVLSFGSRQANTAAKGVPEWQKRHQCIPYIGFMDLYQGRDLVPFAPDCTVDGLTGSGTVYGIGHLCMIVCMSKVMYV